MNNVIGVFDKFFNKLYSQYYIWTTKLKIVKKLIERKLT